MCKKIFLVVMFSGFLFSGTSENGIEVNDTVNVKKYYFIESHDDLIADASRRRGKKGMRGRRRGGGGLR